MNDLDTKEEFTYTAEDFDSSTAPYEHIYNIDNPFLQEQTLNRLCRYAQTIGIKNFRSLYKKYLKNVSNKFDTYRMNQTQFSNQPIELNVGEWVCTDYGVTGRDRFGEILACSHPIMPVERLVNIDTGIEKIKLAFRKNGEWRSVIVEKEMIASMTNIVKLSNMGVMVNSDNARHLIKYLHDCENLNYDSLPEKKCVSRLGWIDGNGFAPYVENLIFDGDGNYKSYFDSVSVKGSFEKWLDLAQDIRANGTLASRIVLAGSFASVLIKPIRVLPFFIHLWGGTETGKTVSLMLASSVWANPEMGKYIHTFNSTLVGQEKSASFVNSLPFIMDELQIIKNNKDFDKIIYMLSEGVGRTRGNKSGGVERTSTWANLILTSGESPLTNTKSGAGAVNRIIEIECKEKLFARPKHVADTLKENFGHSGKIFIDNLQKDGAVQMAKKAYEVNYEALSKSDKTEKQAMAMALVLTADMLATHYIFQDGKCLNLDEVQEYMQTKEAVNMSLRAYDFIKDWIGQNGFKFVYEGNPYKENSEIYGVISQSNDIVYIISSVFNQVLEDNGFNPVALKSWLLQNNLVDVGDNRSTVVKRINGINTRCVALHIKT